VTSPPRPPYPLYARLVSLGLLLPIILMLALVVWAQIDVALMEQYDIRRFAATEGDDSDDDGGPVQAAIDASQARYDAGIHATGAPPVFIPAGSWTIKTPITLKAAFVKCAGPVYGTRVRWSGTADITAMTLSASDPAGSWGGLVDCTFADGDTRPSTWLDTTPVSWLDAGFRLHNVSFRGSSGDAILIGRWANAHFRHLRFDCIGGYAIRATPPTTQNLSSFSLDGFTYDSGSGGCTTAAPGFIMVDNTGNASNLGIFEIANGRIEVHNAWTGPAGVMNMIKGANSRTLATILRNVVYQDTAGMTNDTWHAIDGGTGGSECLILSNVREDALSDVLGTHPASHAVTKAPSLIHNCHTSNGIGQILNQSILQLASVTSSNDLFRALITADAVARLAIRADGRLTWSNGTDAADTQMWRGAADRLAVDAYVQYTGNTPTMGSCGTSPSVVGTMMGGKVTAGSGTVTSCVVNFPLTWSNAPACVANNETTTQDMRATSTTTTLTLAGADFASDVISYVCAGRQ
jgi:hypothetical protein